MDICRTLGQFCDLGVPWLPRAISYYILVIGKEGKWQSPLMASKSDCLEYPWYVYII